MGLDNKKDNRMLSRGGFSHFLVATLSLSFHPHFHRLETETTQSSYNNNNNRSNNAIPSIQPTTHSLPGKGLGISPGADDSSVSVIKRKNNVIRLNAQHGLMVFVARPRNVTLAALPIREGVGPKQQSHLWRYSGTSDSLFRSHITAMTIILIIYIDRTLQKKKLKKQQPHHHLSIKYSD